MPFAIALAPEARRCFASLAPAVKEQLDRVLERIAALAAVAPPVDPVWRRLARGESAALRFTFAGVDVLYEIDLEERTVRIASVTSPELECQTA